jgi:hypothetical protein
MTTFPYSVSKYSDCNINNYHQPHTQALCVVLWLARPLRGPRGLILVHFLPRVSSRVRVARRCGTTKRLGTRLNYHYQGRIQRLNLTVAFWMKSNCVAEGHALPKGVWGHAPPENFEI